MPRPWREWITHDWKVIGEIDQHGRIHSAEGWNNRLHYVPSPFVVKRQPDGRWWREEESKEGDVTTHANPAAAGTDVTDAIAYEEVYGPMADGGPMLHATYRGVLMHIVEGDDWVSIWFMISADPGKGHCQAMIAKVREDFPNKTLCGSVPLSDAAQHIFDKMGVEYPKEDW